MKGLKKWSLLLLAVVLVGSGFVSCSDDDDDDDDAMTYYFLQQQQKQKEEAEKKAQEEANAAPEEKVGVEYTDTESGNKVVMNEDGSKTVTTPQGQTTKVTIVKSFEETRMMNGNASSEGIATYFPLYMKEKYDFYSDGTCLIYREPNARLSSDVSKYEKGWELSQKCKYQGDPTKDGKISLTDIYRWMFVDFSSLQDDKMFQELSNATFAAVTEEMEAEQEALSAAGKTQAQLIAMTKAQQKALVDTAKVRAAKKAYDEADKALDDYLAKIGKDKSSWQLSPGSMSLTISGGKIR